MLTSRAVAWQQAFLTLPATHTDARRALPHTCTAYHTPLSRAVPISSLPPCSAFRSRADTIRSVLKPRMCTEPAAVVVLLCPHQLVLSSLSLSAFTTIRSSKAALAAVITLSPLLRSHEARMGLRRCFAWRADC